MIRNVTPIPNFQSARIDAEKFTEYILNPFHPEGKNKAAVFNSVLGFNRSNADELISQIRQKLPEYNADYGRLDEHGQRYNVDIMIAGPDGRSAPAPVRTGWIIDTDSSIPRLVTTYVI